jgi:hypothetical protein
VTVRADLEWLDRCPTDTQQMPRPTASADGLGRRTAAPHMEAAPFVAEDPADLRYEAGLTALIYGQDPGPEDRGGP